MKKIALYVALLMSFTLFGCGSDSGGGSTIIRESGITISGDTRVEQGSTVQLNAIINLSDGSTSVSGISWESSDNSVATVSDSGLVTGISSGTAWISASNGEFDNAKKVTVFEAGTITISNIVISGARSVKIDDALQLSVAVHYSDGSSDSTGVSWISSDTSIASVSETGLVTGIKAGKVEISAHKGDVSESVQITVSAEPVVVVKQIVISGENSVQANASLPLTAVATYSDNSKDSDGISWKSSNSAIATVNAAGLVKGVAVGEVTITAEKEGLSQTHNMTVLQGDVTPLSIAINGPDSVEALKSIILQATVTYTDGSTGSTGVTWSSADSSVASVSSVGLVTGVAKGSVEISVQSGEITEHKTVTVTEAVVEDGIAIYIQQGAADTIHAWIRSGATDTPVFEHKWPGAPLAEIVDTETEAYAVSKKNDVYKILFKGQQSVWYVLSKSGAQLSGDTEMTQTTYYTADGTKSTVDPFDYRPMVTISPSGGEQKGERVITLSISGEAISSQQAYFNDKAITLSAEGVLSFPLSDYLEQGESGSFTLVATNSEGTKTVNAEFTRNDNKVAEMVEAYGTLEPFAAEAIYFVVTDRFVNGNTENDYRDQGTGVGLGTWDVKIGSANIGYMGGDFEGVYNNADYISDMGFGAVWITPIVDNPDEAFTGGSPCNEGASPGSDQGKTGYHGYWSNNFYQVDEHLPSPGFSFAEYTDKMRDKGLKTVLDIVLNHANPAFQMTDEQYGRSKFGKLYDENGTLVAESNNSEDGGSSWFDGNDQLAQLADFNPDSSEVFEYLSNAQLKWIEEGADAFRIDTIKHMPMAFWKKFVDKMRVAKPGMYMFGEHFDISSGKMNDYQLNAGMDALDFPGKYAMQAVFGGGGGYDGLLGYLHLDDGVINNPYTAATFYDNHDMARMSASDNGFIDAHNWLFTTRGIPVLYYGSEMGFQRGTGEHSGNRNYFGQEGVDSAKSSPIYNELVKIGNIRKESPALQKGLQIHLDVSGDQASFLRVFQHEDVTQTALVLLNKADNASSFNVNQYITPGDWLDAETGEMITVTSGISADVPAHGFKVFLYNDLIEDDALIAKLKTLMD